MQQATAIVNGLLDSQDEDGYIGIYKENLRYSTRALTASYGPKQQLSNAAWLL